MQISVGAKQRDVIVANLTAGNAIDLEISMSAAAANGVEDRSRAKR